MCAQVANSGTSKVELDADEEANSTDRVDTTPTEIMPAQERRHASPSDERSKVVDPAPLPVEPGAHGQAGMPPGELRAAEAMRSEASKAPEETCMTPDSNQQ